MRKQQYKKMKITCTPSHRMPNMTSNTGTRSRRSSGKLGVPNAIFSIAGDHIDGSLGVKFGLSTLAAAGIGNLISDVIGLSAGGAIESAAERAGLSAAAASLTAAPRRHLHCFAVAGKQMSDDKNAAHYNIEGGSVLHLVLALRSTARRHVDAVPCTNDFDLCA